LTARLAPALGASLAGFALGVYPGDQLRLTVAIYIATRAAEFAYNALEDDGWFKNRPWWFGSWMLMPPVLGQLFHAFLFDRDCLQVRRDCSLVDLVKLMYRKSSGELLLKYTPNYVQRRPVDYPSHLSWPSGDGIVDALAEISKFKYP